MTLQDLLADRLTELHPSTFLLVRDRLVAEVGLVDEQIPGSYAEDYEFLLRAARVAPVVHVPEVLVDVLWHQRSYFASRWETIETALTWLLERYPEFDAVPAGKARVLGQIAFAQAARGHRTGAVRTAARTAVLNPREGRAYLALAVASRAVGPDRVLAALHRRGRGICTAHADRTTAHRSWSCLARPRSAARAQPRVNVRQADTDGVSRRL